MQVLLCDETVSLVGIRQFYKLVNSPTTSPTDSSSTSNKDDANTHGADEASPHTAAKEAPTSAESASAEGCGMGAAAEAAESGAAADCAAQPDTGKVIDAQPDEAGPPATAAASPSQPPPLSIAEQQQLLMVKVDALLQLLSSVSFHQVMKRAPASCSLPTLLYVPAQHGTACLNSYF